MDSKTSLITADFSSFEDFSSRMILLPLHDDECTGGKVGNHEVPAEIAVDERVPSEEQCQPPNDSLEGIIGLEDPKKSNDTASVCSDRKKKGSKKDKKSKKKKKQSKKKKKAIPANDDDEEVDEAFEGDKADPISTPEREDAGESIEDQAKDDDNHKNETTNDIGSAGYVNANGCEHQTSEHQNTNMQVPVGYVLVRIINPNDDDKDGMPEDLESIEFSDLLSVLREASFPLSLVFAPPNDTPSSTSHSSNNQGSFFTENDDAESNGPLDVEEELSDNDDSANSETKTTLVSREEIEDAAKYAKQAATQLRGRLSMWGYQAATRAADAASQVKELRDERQRKMKDEQQNRDDQSESGQSEDRSETEDDTSKPAVIEEPKPQDLPVDAGPNPLDVESLDPMEPCFMFMQSPTGFDQLPNDEKEDSIAFPSITNSSVISVRLSKERACPLGKKGYTFQWYHSSTDGGSEDPDISSETDKSNTETQGWSLLPGARYAAYQPSVSDVGHRLRCIINSGTEHQTYHLPGCVAMEQSLLDVAKTTLLGGKKSVTFGNLRGVEDLSIFRLKIDVNSSDDFITSSSIFIDKVSGSKDEMNNDTEPVPHFKVEADPAKPRLFDLICSSHGRLRLDAANRKSRESLILALGIANFKGKLSSLTIETALFPSYETEENIQVESDSTSINSVDASTHHDDPHSRKLEAKLAEMHRLLQSKNVAITKLQRELVSSDATKRKVERMLESCQDSERMLKENVEEKSRTITDMQKARSDAEIVQERTVKALNNEKAVLQAAIKARDGKIESLANQMSELEKKSALQSEQLSSIGSLRSNLIVTQQNCLSAEKVMAKMKKAETELQQDLKSAKGIVLDLNDKFVAAKETASKHESECRKLKMERSSLKNRAEGLSKEMLRMSKSKLEALEIEKLKIMIQELRRENSDMQDKIEVVKSEKRDALATLEATSLAHQQSVSYQLATDGNNNTCAVSEQRIGELESVISSMTEYLDAKEMQIETLKQVNEALSKEVNELVQP